LNGRHN